MELHSARLALQIISSKDEKQEIEQIITHLKSLTIDKRFEFLEFVGKFPSCFGYTNDDLEKIYKITESLPANCLTFAIFLFDNDIKNFKLKEIAGKLKHPLFSQLRNPLIHHLLNALVNRQQNPPKIMKEAIEPLISANINSFVIIEKETYVNLLKIEANSKKPIEKSDGTNLAEKILDQTNRLSSVFKPSLINLEVSQDEIELLRRMAQSYLCKAIRDLNLLDFEQLWGAGSVLFFSCLIFAREQEKELNQNFWSEFYKWTKSPNRFIRSSSKITKTLSSFISNKDILIQTSISGNKQYVTSFRMHSIVANRPRSKELITKFLLRIVKQSGIFHHDEKEQKEILQENLSDDATSIQNREISGDTSTPYLQLPIETAYAFLKNKNQVIEFLWPIYDYVEQNIINSSEGYSDKNSSLESIPYYLQASIDQAIKNTTKEDIQKIRALTGARIIGKVALVYNPEMGYLEYLVSAFLFSDTSKSPSITFTLTVDGEAVYIQQVRYQAIGTDIFTDQIVIHCDAIPSKAVYSFSIGNDIIRESTVIISRIFDLEGFPLINPRGEIQSIYFLATSEEFIADQFELTNEKVIGEYSIYRANLGENSPILIGKTLYGINRGPIAQRAGLSNELSINKGAIVRVGSTDYPILRSCPEFWVLDDKIDLQKDRFKIIADANNIPYTMIESQVTGEISQSYIKLKPCCDFNSIKIGIINFRIFDSLTQKNLFKRHFFVIRDLFFTFSEALYYGPKDVHVTFLNCDQKENIFEKQYDQIPQGLHKFKINPEIVENGRLILNIPIVDVLIDNNSIYDKDIWYEDIVEAKTLEVKIPDNFTLINLKTTDSSGKIIHKLTSYNFVFNTNMLRYLPDTTDRLITLIMVYSDKSGEDVSFEVCRIYYKVVEKNLPEPLYLSSSNIRVGKNLKSGFSISLDVYCGKNRSYKVKVFDPNKKEVGHGPLANDGNYVYHQANEPMEGDFLFKIYEAPNRVFLPKGKDELELIHSIVVPYYYGTKKLNISSTISTEDNLFRGFKVLKTISRILQKGRPVEYKQGINLPNFYIEGSCTLEDDENYAANGYFMNNQNSKKIYLSQSNPLKVKKIKDIEGEIILHITDNNGLPLRVDRFNGYVNSLRQNHGEEILCSWFLAKLMY